MISKKTTISTIIALTALALVTSPSVLTLGSVYALDVFGNNGNGGNDFFSTFFNGVDKIVKSSQAGKNSKTASDPQDDDEKASDSSNAAEPKESSTDSTKPCIRDDNEKGTHYYCEGTHHHCKPGPDNPKCVKT
jgi:hypothetical protein